MSNQQLNEHFNSAVQPHPSNPNLPPIEPGEFRCGNRIPNHNGSTNINGQHYFQHNITTPTREPQPHESTNEYKPTCCVCGNLPPEIAFWRCEACQQEQNEIHQ